MLNNVDGNCIEIVLHKIIKNVQRQQTLTRQSCERRLKKANLKVKTRLKTIKLAFVKVIFRTINTIIGFLSAN